MGSAKWRAQFCTWGRMEEINKIQSKIRIEPYQLIIITVYSLNMMKTSDMKSR